jgi:hypothetical protein
MASLSSGRDIITVAGPGRATQNGAPVTDRRMPMSRAHARRVSPLALLALLCAAPGGQAHPRHSRTIAPPDDAPPAGTISPGAKGVTGQGALRFRILLTAANLPDAARKVLTNAHGGFAVDHRPGKEETYFALPGAGILRLSGDMNQVAAVTTAPEMRDTNLHNTKIWYAPEGTPFLSFPANDAGRVFTTSLSGELLHTLARPTGEDEFGLPSVRDYFAGGGAFVPTDVEFLDGLLYITTGYSSLDTVLTARVTSYNPLRAAWFDLGFGGRGTGPGQLGTGHGITIPPGTRRIDVADRANSEIDRYTRHGQYLSTLRMPSGSLPCDIDYVGKYAVVAALDGPDRSKGAPIYLFEDDRLVSTLMPKEDLGLENFKHIHNAVLRQMGGRLYVIAQAWNPGDFAVLEQVTTP